MSTRIKDGYVMHWFPHHPRLNKKNNGWVFEHILVVERVIGRFLLPGEEVHHKNGVRHDNRPENLELWGMSQPHGIRAVDALAWAREVIIHHGTKDMR